MPNFADIPQLDNLHLDSEPLVMALQQMRKSYALTMVNETFWNYESKRLQNFDRRWNTNDSLYLGWIPARTWEGTSTARSALSMPLVFDQVETALPSIMNALFGAQEEWFQVEPEVGVSLEEAREQAGVLRYALDHGRDDFGLTVKNDFEVAIKCMLIYGYGGVALEWDNEKGRPVVSWCDTRDLYFDPALQYPSIDFARSAIRRSLKTVQEISAWRNSPGMDIPTDDQLWTMARSQKWSTSDQTKQVANALAGTLYTPGSTDFIPNPADRQIEVLTYWDKTRVIVVLNREWVAYVDDNPYGFLPFAFAPCYIVPGRAYPLSIGDVQESNQRYIEALMNLHIDELHMALMPPRATKAGSTMTPSQQRWRPGATFKFADPSKDIALLQPTGATANVFNVIGYIEGLSEKRTGINAMGTGGTPRPSNANRTAAGIQAQIGGANVRLYSLLKHVEDFMLVPALYKMVKMYQVHTLPEQQLPARMGGESTVISASAMQKPVRYKITASSQMLTREKLLNLAPFFLQHLANGPLLLGLQQSGMTIDFSELFKMIMDATGVGKLYSLIRPLTPEEQQARNAPPPEVQAEAAAKQQDAQLRLKLMEMKNQTELQKTQIEKTPEAPSPMEMQMEQMRMQFEQEKAAMAMQMKQLELEVSRQKAAIELQTLQNKTQLDQQKAAMEIFLKQFQTQTAAAGAAQKLDFDRQSSETKLEAQQAQSEQKLESQRQAAKERDLMQRRAAAQRQKMQPKKA